MKKYVIISKGFLTKTLPFGSIVELVEDHGRSGKFVNQDRSDTNFYQLDYQDVYPCEEIYDYEKLNKAIEWNEQFYEDVRIGKVVAMA